MHRMIPLPDLEAHLIGSQADTCSALVHTLGTRQKNGILSFMSSNWRYDVWCYPGCDQ